MADPPNLVNQATELAKDIDDAEKEMTAGLGRLKNLLNLGGDVPTLHQQFWERMRKFALSSKDSSAKFAELVKQHTKLNDSMQKIKTDCESKQSALTSLNTEAMKTLKSSKDQLGKLGEFVQAFNNACPPGTKLASETYLKPLFNNLENILKPLADEKAGVLTKLSACQSKDAEILQSLTNQETGVLAKVAAIEKSTGKLATSMDTLTHEKTGILAKLAASDNESKEEIKKLITPLETLTHEETGVLSRLAAIKQDGKTNFDALIAPLNTLTDNDNSSLAKTATLDGKVQTLKRTSREQLEKLTKERDSAVAQRDEYEGQIIQLNLGEEESRDAIRKLIETKKSQATEIAVLKAEVTRLNVQLENKIADKATIKQMHQQALDQNSCLFDENFKLKTANQSYAADAQVHSGQLRELHDQTKNLGVELEKLHGIEGELTKLKSNVHANANATEALAIQSTKQTLSSLVQSELATAFTDFGRSSKYLLTILKMGELLGMDISTYQIAADIKPSHPELIEKLSELITGSDGYLLTIFEIGKLLEMDVSTDPVAADIEPSHPKLIEKLSELVNKSDDGDVFATGEQDSQASSLGLKRRHREISDSPLDDSNKRQNLMCWATERDNYIEILQKFVPVGPNFDYYRSRYAICRIMWTVSVAFTEAFTEFLATAEISKEWNCLGQAITRRNKSVPLQFFHSEKDVCEKCEMEDRDHCLRVRIVEQRGGRFFELRVDKFRGDEN